LQAWNNYLERKCNLDTSPHKYTTKDLIHRFVCDEPNEECFTNECGSCSTNNSFIRLLTEDFSEDIDFDDLCSWTVWKKINNKFDLQKVNATIDSLLFEMNEQWPSFLLHSYCNRQQREHIALLRSQSSSTSFVIAQIDFSMNYSLVRQREVQQGFFSHQQASLFTTHLVVGKEQRNLAIISDRLEHDTAFVYGAQQIIVAFVKKKFPRVKKINYLR
jgi:hypothetical protein